MAEIALAVVFFFAGIVIGLTVGITLTASAIKNALRELGIAEALRELKSARGMESDMTETMARRITAGIASRIGSERS